MADLSSLLDKEASAEIEAILSEARERASEIAATGAREAETVVASRERSAKAAREANLVRARSSAQLEASSLRLRAQYDAVESVFTEAAEAIRALPDDAARYAPIFKKLLEQALAGVEGDDIAALVVAPADRELASKTAAELGVKTPIETSDEVAGGVYVRTTKNNLVENTLLGRLRALKDELASDVSATLFKGEPGA